ncbi:EutN/CcmL family microcompartment protein [Melioribacter sp. Ez-97]|uniref:EutN/CcmL family microcompartment protein n=1 Tax=Melioribacter sp. Ez-97 TaxID=3423434 RepID=UPI003ED8BF75
MFLAEVVGNVVSTVKNKYLKGHKLLLVNEISPEGIQTGKKDILALDLVDSGIGDKVLVVREGDAVQQILGHNKAPVNTMIIAVVDNIDIAEETIK